MNAFLDVFLGPLLSNLGLYTPADATYGRYLLEPSPYETALEADENIIVSSRRVFLDDGKGQDVKLVKEELLSSRGKNWIFYKMWEKGSGNKCDVVMLHGINDYGGKWAAHVASLLEKGFRIIAPDLPSHGRSSGLHVYINSSEQLTEAVESVLNDVDSFSGPTRKTFLVGASMGGGIALNYCVRHASRQRIAGVFGIAPMIGIAPETTPSPVLQRAARILRFFAGRLPFAKAVKGNLSDDPRVEEEFLADVRCYHGNLRIATGLAILNCISYLTPAISRSIVTPFRIIHGNRDRVTSHLHSAEFHETAHSEDKGLGIYEGYEHVMLKIGVDKQDDAQRQKVLEDLETWLLRRV